MNHLEARRVRLYGVTGAGRTTAAAGISEASGIPWVSLQRPLRRTLTRVVDTEQAG